MRDIPIYYKEEEYDDDDVGAYVPLWHRFTMTDDFLSTFFILLNDEFDDGVFSCLFRFSFATALSR